MSLGAIHEESILQHTSYDISLKLRVFIILTGMESFYWRVQGGPS